MDLRLTSGPFLFDPANRLRCTKCGDSGWVVDGHAAGLAWTEKKALGKVAKGGPPPLPPGWSRSGTVPTDGWDVESWRAVLAENLDQARHVEHQRLGFAGLYGGLSVAASVGALFADPEGLGRWGLVVAFAFMALYTMFQFLLSLKLSKAFQHNMEHVSLALALAPPRAQAARVALFRPMTGMLWFRRWRKVRVSEFFPAFYALLAMFWLGAAVLALLVT
jgi:hypothetical protein